MAFKFFVVLLLFGLSGCGIIYTDVTEPYVMNMSHTPRPERTVKLGTSQLKAPVTNLNLSAEWNSRAIGDAARKNGLTDIYYADIRTQSVLFGLWSRKTILVYGK